jgi:hypothetical protein
MILGIYLLRSPIYDPIVIFDHLTRPYHAVVGPGIAFAETAPVARQTRHRHCDRAAQAESDHDDDGGANRLGQNDLSEGREGRSLGVDEGVLFMLGFGDALGDIIDPGRDEVGLLLDIERLPKRVRPEKAPAAL